MGSKSKSSSSTTTSNADNRVIAEADSVVINSGSSLDYTEEFPEGVQEFVYDILEFAGDVGQGALDVTKDSLDVVEGANISLGERLVQIEQGGANNFIGIAALVVIAVVVVKAFKR